jgi:hypothetical protein
MPVANDLGSITLLRAKRLWFFLMETGNAASRFLSKVLATYALIINEYYLLLRNLWVLHSN